MNWGVVIPAAGRGSRMKKKTNKQFLDLQGLPLVVHTIRLFQACSFVSQIRLVVRSDELDYCHREILQEFNCDDVQLVAGGATRRESVFNGLKSFAVSPDCVIIHDGARPLLSEVVLDRTKASLQEYEAVAAGVKVKDTIKVTTEDSLVKETLDRKNLVAIQTPQAFKYDLIMKAHKEVPDDEHFSDDASLVEALGHPVKVIAGDYENIKITTPIDLVFARMILGTRE